MVSNVTAASTWVGIRPDETAGALPARADIAEFDAQLRQPVARHFNDEHMASSVAQAGARLQQSQQKAYQELQRASRSVDAQQALQASRALSSFYLENLLSAKLVSKAAQSIEKLTTLQ